MSRKKFKRETPPNVGTIGHVDHSIDALRATISNSYRDNAHGACEMIDGTPDAPQKGLPFSESNDITTTTLTEVMSVNSLLSKSNEKLFS